MVPKLWYAYHQWYVRPPPVVRKESPQKRKGLILGLLRCQISPACTAQPMKTCVFTIALNVQLTPSNHKPFLRLTAEANQSQTSPCRGRKHNMHAAYCTHTARSERLTHTLHSSRTHWLISSHQARRNEKHRERWMWKSTPVHNQLFLQIWSWKISQPWLFGYISSLEWRS